MVVVGIGSTRLRPLGDEDLASLRLDRGAQPEQRGQTRIAEPGGENDLRRADLAIADTDAEIARCRPGIADRGVRNVASASFDKRLVQRVQQIERVGMPVIGRPRGADYRWSETRQHVGEFAAVEHAVLEAEIAGLDPHALHPCPALLELGFAEAEMDAARPLVPDRDPGARQQLGGERRPLIGRAPGPALVMRGAVALALYPDQPEIAARGAVRDIAFVDERDPSPSRARP